MAVAVVVVGMLGGGTWGTERENTRTWGCSQFERQLETVRAG